MKTKKNVMQNATRFLSLIVFTKNSRFKVKNCKIYLNYILLQDKFIEILTHNVSIKYSNLTWISI